MKAELFGIDHELYDLPLFYNSKEDKWKSEKYDGFRIEVWTKLNQLELAYGRCVITFPVLEAAD
jgi:hypothetical protein